MGATDALFTALFHLDHIANGQTQNQSNNADNNQIFHNLLFTFQGLCLRQFLIGLGN